MEVDTMGFLNNYRRHYLFTYLRDPVEVCVCGGGGGGGVLYIQINVVWLYWYAYACWNLNADATIGD